MTAHLLKSAHNSHLLTIAHGSLLPELHLSWRTDGDFTYLHVTGGYISFPVFFICILSNQYNMLL